MRDNWPSQWFAESTLGFFLYQNLYFADTHIWEVKEGFWRGTSVVRLSASAPRALVMHSDLGFEKCTFHVLVTYFKHV